MPGTVSREELKRKMDAKEDFVLIDVLLPQSYQREHLPDAINIPLHKLNQEAVARLPRDKEIIVYCASFECQASPTAAGELEKLGFTRVLDFEGGLEDWRNAGYPLETGGK